MASQSSNRVFMVSPTHFVSNAQAALDNYFMSSGEKLGLTEQEITKKAIEEFNGLVSVLRSHGVDITIYTPPPPTSVDDVRPDAVFPNNWFSTHRQPETDESILVLYPMKVPNRRTERRPEVISVFEGNSDGNGVVQGSILKDNKGYNVKIDLSNFEKSGVYLEGTGSLLLDRVHKVAYACLSERTHRALFEKWAKLLGYDDIVTFHSVDKNGGIVYHTNVVMAIGTGWAIVCEDSVQNSEERKHLMDKLRKYHEVITVTHSQVNDLCGNVLEVRDGQNRPIIAMSTRSYEAFTEEQKKSLLKHVHALVHAPIPTIETIGGGGVRCSLSELF
eukprot:TRINITY_DN343_c0_g1_i1.p1 TRINITY_DN343_c0_g1~~TRINITY_DN343_c0_g1_i1.p1  ORF type:complete len:332 (+),score=68.87 TRINITY_DN343_c0_g1_i1:199-1194(+)